MALTRLYQLVFEPEQAAGSYVGDGTLLQAANAGLFISDPSFAFAPESFTREVVTGSLSPSTPLIGATPATFTFSVAVAGTTGYQATPDTVSAQPKWFDLMRACGFHQVRVVAQPVVALGAGDIIFHGETFDWTSGKTYQVFTDQGGAGVTSVLLVQTGTVANDGTEGAAVGSISGVSLDPTAAPTNAGHGFQPISIQEHESAYLAGAESDPVAGGVYKGQTTDAVITPLIVNAGTDDMTFRVLSGTVDDTTDELYDRLDTPVTGAFTLDQDGTPALRISRIPTLSMALIEDGRIKVARGMLGSVSISGELGQNANLNFSFSGVLEDALDGVAFTAATFNELVPPVLLGQAGFSLAVNDERSTNDDPADAVTPCINSFTFDIGHTIGFRRCMDDPSGLVGSGITSRAPTGTIDPEVAPESFYSFIDNASSNIPFRFTLTWGPAASGNRFLIQAPACYVTGETPGDRDGVGISEYNLQLSSRNPAGGERTEAELLFLIRHD